MKPLKSELKQLEQRREATIELLNQLLEELEGAPVQRRRHSWHPLDLLESAVNELVPVSYTHLTLPTSDLV